MRSYSVNVLLFLILTANGCLFILNQFDEQPATILNRITSSFPSLTTMKVKEEYSEYIRKGIAISYCILGLGFLLKFKWPCMVSLILSLFMITTIDNPFFNKSETYKEITVITHLLIIGIVLENIQNDSIKYNSDLSKIKVE